MSGLDDLTREELIDLVLRLHETVQSQAKRISELEDQISKLGGSKPASTWVKPSSPKKEKGPRKKRIQSFARMSLVPTDVVCHALDTCPDCGRKLKGGTVKFRHQVIEIPKTPAKVTDHLFVERCCGVCGKRVTPDANVVLGDIVVGKKSIAIDLMSLVAYLKIVCRIPVSLIRQLLISLYGFKVSRGEICELCTKLPEWAKMSMRVCWIGFSCSSW